MPANLLKALAFMTGAGTLAGLAYSVFALSRVRRFRKSAEQYAAHSSVPVTILKPLHGNEPRLFEHLSTFCDQDYPAFQIVFGAADPNDPALDVARAVAQRFPSREIEIVSGNARSAGNPKIGNLLGMIERARYEIVIIADSDIQVGRTYIQAVAACFGDPQTGAATCIYGGVPGPSFASRLGAMHVNDHFAPSVMVANALEPLNYCFGATMAVRSHLLTQIGGLESLADHLADDYLLGKLITEAGYRVALVPYAVQTGVADESLLHLWRHELRWARAILGQRPAGYAGSIVTYVLPFALAFALAAPGPVSFFALVLAATLRTLQHYEARAAFAPQCKPTPWLIPLRDLFSVAVWIGSFFGKRVVWKTDEFQLDAAGRMAQGPGEV